MASSLTSSTRFSETFYIFIGSSTESKALAEIIVKTIEDLIRKDSDNLKLVPEPWYIHFETEEKAINEMFLEEFPEILNKCEFSLFIVSKDDLLIKRSQPKGTVRDNVWFEAGMFMGKRGRTKTYFFLNLNDFHEIHFPTDITGLTLPGVKWDTEIADLFFKKSKILKKHPTVSTAVENKIKEEIEKYCSRLILKIKHEIKQPLVSEEAVIITDRKRCFQEGIKLVQNASERLYTTISFSRSLTPKPTSEEIEMQTELQKKISEKNTSFKRYMNLNVGGIREQYNTLKSLIDSVNPNPLSDYLYQLNFDYLEMIISDNNIIMVFPDYRGNDTALHEKVAFGFLIKENKELADVLSEWLMKKLGKI